MRNNFRFFIQMVSIILLIILVFMNFFEYWTADRFVQILFFFGMIFAIFSMGIEVGKKQKKS